MIRTMLFGLALAAPLVASAQCPGPGPCPAPRPLRPDPAAPEPALPATTPLAVILAVGAAAVALGRPRRAD